MKKIRLKRIYDPYLETDGYRILIDRLWPRGVKKEEARLFSWYKEIAPSPELRKWFDHKEERFDEFRHLYLKELQTDVRKQERLTEIRYLLEKDTVTLLFGAKNRECNHAVVLKEVLEKGNF